MLTAAPNFGFGLGMHIHIRTTVRYAYSYIETAAIKIGNDIFQIASFGQYYLNGISNADMPNSISGYVVQVRPVGKHEYQFFFDLEKGRHLTVKVFKDMLTFKFHLPGTQDEFRDTEGLLGQYGTGLRLARNGTVLNDPDEFGQEWQVRDTDPQLFMTLGTPAYPSKCIMPDPVQAKKRRLSGTISHEVAEDACSHIIEREVRDMCIFDVISTEDVSVAASDIY